MIRSPDISTFRKNNDNNEVVRFSVDSGSNKVS